LRAVGAIRYRSLPSWSALHPFDPGAHAVGALFYDLARESILFRTDSSPVREYSDADPSLMRVGTGGRLLYELMRLDRIPTAEKEGAGAQLQRVSDQPKPWDLLSRLDSTVDSERLTDTDLERGYVRFALDERTQAVLPGTTSEPYLLVRGEQLACHYTDAIEQGVGGLIFDGPNEQTLRELVRPGEVLRLSRGHDGTLWLD
jgi:hypothetical protein